MKLDKKNFAELVYFIRERHKIYELKKRNAPKPWTKDAILQQYRFCNVYRELDTVTKWIAENYVRPHVDDSYLWFALLVARSFNEPNALLQIGYPVPWKPEYVKRQLSKHAKRGLRVFNSAYNTPHCIGERGRQKHLSICDKLFTPLWARRTEVVMYDTLQSSFEELHKIWAVGSFMAAQIIADIKHTPQFKSRVDWRTFCASGPGSRRGLNRVCGRPVDTPWKEEQWRETALLLRDVIAPQLKDMPELDMQNMQGCLCEIDKYLRAKSGEGRPKQRYPGA